MKFFYNSVLLSSLLSALLIDVAFASEANDKAHQKNALIKSNDDVVSVTRVIPKEKRTLMNKLANINNFSAVFNQNIYDENGELLQQGHGQLSVSRPDLVYWNTQSPDESLIVSDGDNLWFYDPLVEQVSVYSFANAIADTPVLLITNNDKSLWENYQVIELSQNQYTIKSLDEHARIESLVVTFDVKNEQQISELSLLDNTGQLSKFTLSEHKNSVDHSLFQFIVPDGVHIDDQR